MDNAFIKAVESKTSRRNEIYNTQSKVIMPIIYMRRVIGKECKTRDKYRNKLQVSEESSPLSVVLNRSKLRNHSHFEKEKGKPKSNVAEVCGYN